MNRNLIRMVAAFAVTVIACAQAQAIPTVQFHLLDAPVFDGNTVRIPLRISFSDAGPDAGIESLDIDLNGSEVNGFTLDLTNLGFDPTGGVTADWELPFVNNGTINLLNLLLLNNDIPQGASQLLLGSLLVDISGLNSGDLVLIDIGGNSVAAFSEPFGDPQSLAFIDTSDDSVLGAQIRFEVPTSQNVDVPEPATITLGALSLLGLARRRRTQAA